MTQLAVRDLSSSHGQLRAVRSVSLDLQAGEILALVGANGAGKSTLLRTLAGAHRAAAGTIALKDEDVTGLRSFERVKKGLVLVPEGRRLFADMTVEENLLLGGVSGRKGYWTIDTVMQAFPNLQKLRGSRAQHLSGGEQQATAIGRALITNPDVILLDEISLGLSPAAVDKVYVSLARVVENGTTVILVEQDLGRAMAVAGRIACMLEGQIVLDKPVKQTRREEVTEAYFGKARRRAQ